MYILLKYLSTLGNSGKFACWIFCVDAREITTQIKLDLKVNAHNKFFDLNLRDVWM
jgi:hypothetical protein